MGVKIWVREGETLSGALIRFRRKVRRYGPPGTRYRPPKPHKNQLTFFQKPTQQRRQAEFVRFRAASRSTRQEITFSEWQSEERVWIGMIPLPEGSHYRGIHLEIDEEGNPVLM